jgi:hypothetical protein
MLRADGRESAPEQLKVSMSMEPRIVLVSTSGLSSFENTPMVLAADGEKMNMRSQGLVVLPLFRDQEAQVNGGWSWISA